MFRWAHLPHLLVSTVLLATPCFAQSPEQTGNQPGQTDAEKKAPTRQQSALGMLDEVLAATKNLSLPQNRLTIEAQAFPILWERNQSHARALVNQMAGEFAQAVDQRDENLNGNLFQILRNERQVLLQTIAQHDPELALNFLAATQPYVKVGTPEENENEERQLRLNLATQIAAHNPHAAFQTAEKELQSSGELPYELVSLLGQVENSDEQTGLQLFRDITNRVKGIDLSASRQDFGVALNLLNNEFSRASGSGNAGDDAIRGLADSVAAAVLSPQFPQDQVASLQDSLPMFDQLVPGKAQALHQKLGQFKQSMSPEQKVWDNFNRIQANVSAQQLLALAAQAPASIRGNMYQQIGWKFANDGDVQKTREMADSIADPAQRAQLLQQAIRQAAASASNRGEFPAARQLAEQIVPEEERVNTLVQIAFNAAGAKQETLAQEILDEAASLIANRLPSASEFSAQLQVAQAFIHFHSERAVPLLERSASQLEQVLAAAEQVDAFLPYQRSFEGGELILNNSFLFNSLIQPYAMAAAELANSDLTTARTLADRLPLPEARLVAELFVARSALGGSPATITLSQMGGLQRVNFSDRY